MSDDSQLRERILEVLELIASADEQRRYQQRAPHVDVPAELFNQWDDWYRPGVPGAERAFSGAELQALARFHTVLDEVAGETPRRLPALDAFQATEAWQRLAEAARRALEALGRRD